MIDRPKEQTGRKMTLAANEYLLIGTGERFRNADGASRQDQLSRCESGEGAELRRERDNPHDRMAVQLSCRYDGLFERPRRKSKNG